MKNLHQLYRDLEWARRHAPEKVADILRDIRIMQTAHDMQPRTTRSIRYRLAERRG